jgi:hypothetical protein
MTMTDYFLCYFFIGLVLACLWDSAVVYWERGGSLERWQDWIIFTTLWPLMLCILVGIAVRYLLNGSVRRKEQ